MNRRVFLQAGIVATALCAFIPDYRVRLLFNKIRYKCLTKKQIAFAVCLSEIIFPQDECFGAIELGIENYIVRQMNTPFFKTYYQSIISLYSYFQIQAKKQHGKSFLVLSGDIQKKMVSQLMAHQSDQRIIQLQNNVASLIEMTIEGCFSDPMHGGNKNAQAWQLMKDSFSPEWMYA